jgi:hypothetical protein
MVGKLKGLGGSVIYGEGNKGFFVLQYFDEWAVVMGSNDGLGLTLIERCELGDELYGGEGRWGEDLGYESSGGCFGVRGWGSRNANLVQKEVQVNIKKDKIRKFEDRDRLEGWDLGPVENSGSMQIARQKN